MLISFDGGHTVFGEGVLSPIEQEIQDLRSQITAKDAQLKAAEEVIAAAEHEVKTCCVTKRLYDAVAAYRAKYGGEE